MRIRKNRMISFESTLHSSTMAIDGPSSINRTIPQTGDSASEESNLVIASVIAKEQAMEAAEKGKFNESIKLLTKAIELNPKLSSLYVNRAAVYNLMKKAKSAIIDANTAIQINPTSTRGHKTRQVALLMLGEWEETVKDVIHPAVYCRPESSE